MELFGLTQTTHLWVFFVMVFGIIVLPGLDMAYVMASSLVGGRRAGAAALLGIVAGGVVHTVMAVIRERRGNVFGEPKGLCVHAGGVSAVFETRLWADGNPGAAAGRDHRGDADSGLRCSGIGCGGDSNLAERQRPRAGAGGSGGGAAAHCRCRVDWVARLALDAVVPTIR